MLDVIKIESQGKKEGPTPVPHGSIYLAQPVIPGPYIVPVVV